MTKILFIPFSVIGGFAAGKIATLTLDRLWRLIDKQQSPEPDQRAVGWLKLILGLALEGAVFRVVRGSVDRGFRELFARLTGSWPGEEHQQGLTRERAAQARRRAEGHQADGGHDRNGQEVQRGQLDEHRRDDRVLGVLLDLPAAAWCSSPCSAGSCPPATRTTVLRPRRPDVPAARCRRRSMGLTGAAWALMVGGLTSLWSGIGVVRNVADRLQRDMGDTAAGAARNARAGAAEPGGCSRRSGPG